MKQLPLPQVSWQKTVVVLIACWAALLLPLSDIQAQSSLSHTLQLEPATFSHVQIQVDGMVVFDGVLGAKEKQIWTGNSFHLTIETTEPATVIYDGVIQGTVGQAGKVITVEWPNAKLPAPQSPKREPILYRVQPNDTLYEIALNFDTDVETLLAANQLQSSDLIYAGTLLTIPGSDGSLPVRQPVAQLIPMDGAAPVSSFIRGSVVERQTTAAQAVPPTSPFYKTTWLTYYGRPAVPVMGILGEYKLDELTTMLKKEATAYDAANGADLAVQPAYHIVYGMATKAPNDDNSHLFFLDDATVETYIKQAQKEKFAVILDIQIGALSPADALRYGLPWLAYENVHLALDPEFAMAHKGQVWPGDPIGFVTATQINDAQEVMQAYMEENNIEGQRILLVHQFLDTMIDHKADLDWSYERLVLTLSADGWGGPWGKISKYNLFMDDQTRFTAFKLFYRWDEPLMTPREALGIDGFGEGAFIDVTPNLVIYQ